MGAWHRSLRWRTKGKVAFARRLAVVFHRMWIERTDFSMKKGRPPLPPDRNIPNHQRTGMWRHSGDHDRSVKPEGDEAIDAERQTVDRL
ncbi:hypothetical protein [Mesorhizobium sp. M1163]|uniref:hypothetical protein n=1 Tax=Mesorhizobium sp. M1163 TaxID=2957065 RepID=UPI003339F06C